MAVLAHREPPETLPEEHRLAGNAMFSMLGTTGYIAGPALAGLLVAVGGRAPDPRAP
ncbi:MAG: hypothetical protein ACM3ML_30855 [Micromonosporaceae bacterium]